MFRLLVVEDAPDFQLMIKKSLSDYVITCCESAEKASILLRNEPFDLLVIDINLPGRNGYSLVSEVRASNFGSELPILCLTGRSDVTDKVIAFSLGADDYITKPFEPLELRARVDAKLKRNKRDKSKLALTVVGHIEIDLEQHKITVVENKVRREISLTPIEFKLLTCLSRRPGNVYTRNQLLTAAWGDKHTSSDRGVDVHICSLRKKLGRFGSDIQSITGLGYKLAPDSSRRAAWDKTS